MNIRKTFAAFAVMTALIAGVAFAADEAKKEAPAGTPAGCCVKAEKNGAKCTHPCCVEAAKASKNCEKCKGTNEAKK